MGGGKKNAIVMVRLSVNWQVTFISRQVWQSRHFHQTDSFKLWQTWEPRMDAVVIDIQISWLQADRHLKQSWLRDNRAVFELMQAGNSLDYGRTKAVFAGGSLSLAAGPSVIIALLRTVPAHNILSPISLIDPFVPFPPSNLSQYRIFNNPILILNSW